MHRKICFYMDEVDQLKEGIYVSPITCEVDPSNRCLLNCNFCIYADFLSSNKTDLPLETFYRLVNELKEEGVKSITFTGGGEPLMNPGFNVMATYAFNQGFEIGLITNGVLADKIVSPEKFTFIRVSLDAYNRDSYIETKGKDFFDRVIANIKNLTTSKTDVGISYVVCETNKKGIERVEEIGDKTGVDYIQFKPVVNIKEITPSLTGLKGTKSVVTNRFSVKGNLPCVVAGLIGVVGADQNVYYCCQHRGNANFSIGNLSKESFNNIWAGRRFFTPNVFKCPSCRYSGYAKTYEDFNNSKYKFLRHVNFL